MTKKSKKCNKKCNKRGKEKVKVEVLGGPITAVELRKLAADIEHLGRESRVWSISYKWIMTLTEHICAVARLHETRKFDAKVGAIGDHDVIAD